IHLNAIGTLEITLKSQKTDHIWGLEFQLRSASGQENNLDTLAKSRKDEVFDQSYLVEPKKSIEELFSSNSSFKPDRIIERLELQLQQSKREWSPSILRGLGDALLKSASQRKISQTHEARWWNLAGLFLMPGYGFPLDDFRIKELWKVILSEAKLPSSAETQLQKWICFRRLSGGFNKGQQLQLAHELVSQLLKKNGKIEVKSKAEFSHYAEKIRAFAVLELIDPILKAKVGNALIDRIVSGQAISAEYWALARIGARHLFYGTSTNVVNKDICAKWIQSLLNIPLEISEDTSKEKDLCFVITQLARKSDCRETNLSQGVIDSILNRLSNFPEFQKLQKTLLEVTPMTSQEQDRIFGEHLPAGLSINREEREN
ncbi:MAG: molecular chaperone DnaK, partial [Parachlamydiaceae bacterium]